MNLFVLVFVLGIYLFPSVLVYLILAGKIRSLEGTVRLLLENRKLREKSPDTVCPKPSVTQPESPENNAPQTPRGNVAPKPSAVPFGQDLRGNEVPSPPPVPIPAMSDPTTPFAVKLREWKILPSENMPLEIAVMQWWAPRIGGVLALLALIFFGVWASQFSSPLVKVLEMAAVAVGIAGFGLYLNRHEKNSLGDSLTATGTTMFYLVALAAGTFPSTKIFDSIPVALLVQILAIVPTILLGRGKFIPMLLSLVFAFVSALFAVLNGAGTAALGTSLLAYIVAAWFCTKKNTLGLLLAGAIGAFLPLWTIVHPEISPEVYESLITESNETHSVVAMLLGATSLGVYLTFFVVGIVIPNCVLLKTRNTSVFGKFIYAVGSIHALVATALVMERFRFLLTSVRLCPDSPDIIFALFFTAATLVFLSAARLAFCRFRENKFLFEFNFVAGMLALSAAIIAWIPSSGKNVLFYAMLAQALLLAYAGRSLNTKWTLISLIACLGLSIGASTDCTLLEACLRAAVTLIAVAWFFGNKKQWQNEFPRIIALVVCAGAGILSALTLYDASLALSNLTVVCIVFPLSCLAVLTAGTLLPHFTKKPFLWSVATWGALILCCAAGDVFIEKLTFSHWLVAGVIVVVLAVPALRYFIKNEKIGSAAELSLSVPILICLTGILFLRNHFHLAGFAFLLPLVALFAGTPWRKNSAILPLARRGAEASALPLLAVIFFLVDSAILKEQLRSPIVPVALALYVFLPFCFSAMRRLLRERPWFAVAASVSGTLCLLYWGDVSFPRFLTAEGVIIAIALIFAGLLARVSSVRIVGIILLAGMLLRLFLCDISDTIWRIVAFASVAAALFLIGFLYQRLSKIIEK